MQQVGGGTYTVSIPISWAEEHGLEAGETAYLYTHRDGSLVVRWGDREERAFGGVDVELDDRAGAAAARTLDAAYGAGFDRITFHTTAASQRESIAERARTLIGVDVTEESDSHVEVRWLLEADDLSIQQSVRQLRFVAASMHEAAMATVAGATAEAEYIVDRTEETDRLRRLIERRFTRALVSFEELDRLGASRPRLFAGYRTARELDRVAAEAAGIARAVDRLGPAESSELVEEIRAAGVDAREAVEAATDAVTDGGSTATVHELRDRAGATAESTRELHGAVAAADPPDAVLLTRVLDGVRRTVGHARAIGAIAGERTVPA